MGQKGYMPLPIHTKMYASHLVICGEFIAHQNPQEMMQGTRDDRNTRWNGIFYVPSQL